MHSCLGCLYWRAMNAEGPQQQGECRAHAPRYSQPVVLDGFTHYEPRWATTNPDDWCGEFRPLPVVQNPEPFWFSKKEQEQQLDAIASQRRPDPADPDLAMPQLPSDRAWQRG